MISRTSATAIGVLALSMLLVGCERAKTKLDREVDRLCAVDGGVHIYETVDLPGANFGPDGELSPKFTSRLMAGGQHGTAYQSRFIDELLVAGDPALQRIRVQIVRISDQKILGEVVLYRRSGGDLPGPWEPSTYSCPAGPVFNLERHIFHRQGK